MDPKGLLSLSLLLFLSLVFEWSCGVGGDVMNCPEIVRQLGGDVLLPLSREQIRMSSNQSVHILVTMAKARDSSVKRKVVSLDPSEGGSPSYLEEGHRFHLENLSLEILGSRRESEGWYFMSLEENVSVQQFCVQLILYEQVSTPEIKVLNRTQENGTCRLILACAAEKGDQVAYSWSEEPGTLLQSPPNGSHLLHLLLGPQHANSTFTCTARNPVSNRSQAFSPWHMCTSGSSGSRQWGLYTGLFLGAFMGIIMILQVVILLLRRGKASRDKPVVEEKGLTIYAQVQQSGPQQQPDPLPAQDPCSTIYVAAAEPVPGPSQGPNPITVYASVTLPES